MLKYLAIYSLLLTTLNVGFASSTRIGADTINVGKPGSTGTVKIKANDGGFLKKDNGGPWYYSNDGLLEKKIGSGSGTGGSGGVDILENSSFEDGLTGWTHSGGNLTQETYVNSVDGDTKFLKFATTVPGDYFESVAKPIPDNFGYGCQADFKAYKLSIEAGFKVQVLDSLNRVLTEQTLPKSSTWKKIPTLTFRCPASGELVKIRAIALLASNIEVDKGYLGSNQNIVNVSQARLMGTITITGCSTYWGLTSTTFADFTPQSGCSYVATGSASAPSTNIPAIKFASLPAGDYRLEFEGRAESSSSGIVASYQFSDGVNTAREVSSAAGSSSAVTTTTISQTISYATAQSNVTLSLKGKVNSGSNFVYGTNTQPGVIKIWYFPSGQDVAIIPETSEWFIDANIGGANVGISTIASSFTEITNASLDLVINTAKGSFPAQIACANGTDSTGLTCSGANESIGLTFTNPRAGTYETMCSFGSSVNSSNITYQLVETSPLSSAIIQEGGQRADQITTAANTSGSPVVVRGTFNFPDSKRRTIRLMYESNQANSQITADRNAAKGQPDIHCTIRPILSEFNRPILSKRIREIVAVSGPDASAPYSWYEVYSDGWVRQGKIRNTNTSGAATYTFPIEMKDTRYNVTLVNRVADTGSAKGSGFFTYWNETTTSFQSYTDGTVPEKTWSVEGYGNSVAVKALGANPNY